MEVNTAVKDGGGSMTSFETQGANVKKCSIRRSDGEHFKVTISGNVYVDGKCHNCDVVHNTNS